MAWVQKSEGQHAGLLLLGYLGGLLKMQDRLCSFAGAMASTLAQASQMMLGKARVPGTQVSEPSGCRVSQVAVKAFRSPNINQVACIDLTQLW